MLSRFFNIFAAYILVYVSMSSIFFRTHYLFECIIENWILRARTKKVFSISFDAWGLIKCSAAAAPPASLYKDIACTILNHTTTTPSYIHKVYLSTMSVVTCFLFYQIC